MSLRAALHAVRDADRALAGELPVGAHGLEAVIAGGFLGVERSDWVFCGARERVGGVLRGVPLERLADPLAGARPWRMAPVTGHPALRMIQACGVAMANPQDAVLCFIGQGSASYGEFHEALNLAALHRLHVIFVAHRWDLNRPGAPLARQVAGTLLAKALAYGIHARHVDGGLVTDVLSAVADARAHGGPQFIEAQLAPGEDPLRRAYEELTESDPEVVGQAT